MLSGPLFAATWPIYRQAPPSLFLALWHFGARQARNRLTQILTWKQRSDSALAPAFATVVPGIQVVKLLAVGSGLVRDEDAVRSISRGGDAKELLRGPLYYAVVLTLLTCIYWRSSPCGILTISLLCGGDGLADILGRALKGPKLPWNASKTYAGTLSMLFAGGSLAGLFYLVFSASGCLHVDASEFTRLTICASLAATFAESLPINKLIDDNISVPVATLAVCYLFGA